MDNYWLRIGVRAGIIFAVGLALVQVGKAGKRKVTGLLDSNDPITIPIGFMPFNVDGTRYGTVRTLKLLRDDSQHLREVQVNVRLGDRADAAALPTCELYLDHTDKIDEKSSFTCVAQDRITSGEVQRLGQVVLTPTDRRIEIWGDSAAVNELRRGKIGAMGGRDASKDVAAFTTQANEQIAMHADSNGAVQVIKGTKGEVIQMNSDASGFHMSVTGANGEHVLLQAGPGGVTVHRSGDAETSRIANAYADAKVSAAAARARGDQEAAVRAEDRAKDILDEMDEYTPEQLTRVIELTASRAGREAALPVERMIPAAVKAAKERAAEARQEAADARAEAPIPPKPPRP